MGRPVTEDRTYQLAILNGSVVTPDGVERLDIYVDDGRIAVLAAHGVESHAARETVDASGLLVIPGGIDPHVHADLDVHLVDGTVEHGGTSVDLSRAAIYGGTTTLIDFAWNDGTESLRTTVEQRDSTWAGESLCDYSFHVGLLNALSPERLDQVPGIIADGFPSFKIFTTNVFPNAPLRFKLPLESVRPLAEVVSESDGLLVIHAEDDELVMDAYAEAIATGRTQLDQMSRVHSTLSERVAIARVLSATEDVPGARLYFMHVSAGDGVREIAKARAQERSVWGETLHQYLLVNDDEYERPEGVLFHTYPSIKGEADSEELWRGIERGEIATIATDAVCTPLAWKMQGQNIDTAVGGNVGIEPRVAIMYTEMVEKRGMPVGVFVDEIATNAAKLMDMYPRKGVIALGSDADLAALDITGWRTIDAADLHESDYTPWQDRSVTGWPTLTVLAGRVLMRDGELLDHEPHGLLIGRSPKDHVEPITR